MPEMPGSTALISRLLLASLPTRPLLLFFKPWIVLFLHLYLDKTQTSAEGREEGGGEEGGDGRKKKKSTSAAVTTRIKQCLMQQLTKLEQSSTDLHRWTHLITFILFYFR